MLFIRATALWLCAILLEVLMPAQASTVLNNPCSSQVDFHFLAVQNIPVWGSNFGFGKFVFKNNTKNEIRIPLSAGEGYIIPSLRTYKIQMLDLDGSWQDVDVVLRELTEATSSVSVSKGGGIDVFLSGGSFAFPKPINIGKKYRVALNDSTGCTYYSATFIIQPDQ
jgi:hypothetical protein